MRRRKAAAPRPKFRACAAWVGRAVREMQLCGQGGGGCDITRLFRLRSRSERFEVARFIPDQYANRYARTHARQDPCKKMADTSDPVRRFRTHRGVGILQMAQ